MTFGVGCVRRQVIEVTGLRWVGLRWRIEFGCGRGLYRSTGRSYHLSSRAGFWAQGTCLYRGKSGVGKVPWALAGKLGRSCEGV